MKITLKFTGFGYYPIPANLLDICKDITLDSLYEIDDFASKYTKNEIIESAMRSNYEFPESDDIKLVITFHDEKKLREYALYTKDDKEFLEFDVLNFLKDNITNKNIINQLKNFFECKNYIPNDLIAFISNINDNSIIQILHDYSNLCYLSHRLLKEYIFNNIVVKEEKNKCLKKEI